MRTGLIDIERRLQFLGFFINLTPEEMENLHEDYLKEIGENASSEEKFNVSFRLMPKPTHLKLDFRQTAYQSLDQYENKRKTSLKVILIFLVFKAYFITFIESGGLCKKSRTK